MSRKPVRPERAAAAPAKTRRQAGPTARPAAPAGGGRDRETTIATIVSAVLVIAASVIGWIGYQATLPHPAPSPAAARPAPPHATPTP